MVIKNKRLKYRIMIFGDVNRQGFFRFNGKWWEKEDHMTGTRNEVDGKGRKVEAIVLMGQRTKVAQLTFS
jgi:hypothetical protein